MLRSNSKNKSPLAQGPIKLASFVAPILLLTTSALVPTHLLAQSIVVFGDSSADLGSQGASMRPTNKGEMWSEALAKRVGKTTTFARSLTYDANGDLVGNKFTGGNSYAINGSTASRFAGVPTLSDQVSFYIQDRKSFNKDDLVFVWITRNDITSAFFEGSVYKPETYANDYITAIKSMQGAGARNIVAFGAETKLLPTRLLFDGGLTQTEVDALSLASKASDAALWPKLTARNVYILDTDRLAEDVRTNPTKYGFKFTTDNYQGRGDTSGTSPQSRSNDGNVFTEDGHYTTAMQLVVSDFTLAQVRARDQYLTNLLQTGYRFRANLATIDANRVEGQAIESTGWRIFGGTSFDKAESGGERFADVKLEQETFYGQAGADYRTEGGLLIGGSLDLGIGSGDYADKAGKVEQNTVQIAGYVSKQLNSGFFIHATASGGGVRFTSIERTTNLGATAKAKVKGDTGAQYQSAAIGLGQTTRLRGIILTGDMQFAAEKAKIKAYREDEGVLALSYGDSEFSSDVLSLGLRIEREPEIGQINPYAAVKWSHDFKDDSVRVKVGPTSTTIVDYVTERPFTDEFTLQIGASYQNKKGLEVRGGLTTTQYSGASGAWGTVGIALNVNKKL
jgi:phospholipase/lecithinase/hemolysin/uncharacterized protein YhjY with autotransporter beta-barrel domain